jgi:hypothetical protein
MVVVIGIPVPVANSSSSSCRPKRWISTPAMITGRRLWAIRRAASATASDRTSASPTGSWEIDANFFDRRLQIYGKAQVAFILSTIEVNSGPFVTMTEETGGTSILLADANLSESREKSVWNTAVEVGLRYTFFRSLTVEVGYHRAGFLDAIILPSQIIVPEKEQTIPNGTSALYGTQDYRVEGWHAGLGFQF